MTFSLSINWPDNSVYFNICLWLSYDCIFAVAPEPTPVITTPLSKVDVGFVINILWNDVLLNTASLSKLYPWSVIVSFSIAPISGDHANNLAPVPPDTFASVVVFAVDDVAPVIVSFDWNTPVCVLVLFMTSLLLELSILRICAVAFDVLPVIVSPAW